MKNTKINLLELSIKKKLSFDFLGSYKTAFKGTGLIFQDLRQYVVGDSIKNIDWKTSAKHNDLYVKNYEEERNLKVLFVMDISKSMMFGSENKTKLDLLMEIFFTLAFSASINQDSIGIVLYNGEKIDFIEFLAGEENIFRAIKKINILQKTSIDEKNINIKILKKLESIKIRNSLVFMLSDKMEFDKSIFKLFGVENELVYINIFDYFENNLSDENLILNFKNKSNFINIFLNDKKRQDFIKLRQDKIDKFKLNLKKVLVDYVFIDTKTDILKTFLQFFNSKKI